MEDILTRAGAVVKQDKIWELPMAEVFRGDMLDFHDDVFRANIGDKISIDTRVHSEVIAQNAINRRAGKLNCKASRNDENRPIITYQFITYENAT